MRQGDKGERQAGKQQVSAIHDDPQHKSRITFHQECIPRVALSNWFSNYLFAVPRLMIPATSATRLPSAAASASSFSSMPGESDPVVAVAPRPPPPLVTTI